MLNARTLELLEQNENGNIDLENTEDCDKTNCPAVLNNIWVRQIRNQQNTYNKAYAKKHSLEFALTGKILSVDIADRSNKTNLVA